MRAAKARHPRWRSSFAYSPQGVGRPPSTLAYIGEMSEEWLIYDVDPDAGPLEVATCPDLPQPGFSIAEHDDWLCSRIDNLVDTADVNKESGNVTWKCVVVYVPDPSALPVEIHYSSNRVMEVVSKDVATGEAIVNKAGDPFNPPVQEARARMRIRVVKRYVGDEFLYAGTIKAYADHQSSADWDIPGIGTVLAGHAYCTGIDAPLVKEPVWHQQCHYEFEIDVDQKFVAKLLNCGYQYKDSGGAKVLFADDKGTPHGGIGLLASDGTKGDAASPVFLEFTTKPTADFNDLELF